MFEGTATDYIDGIEYQDGTLNFIHMEEGRIVKSGAIYSYEYMLRDHLGNTRSGFNASSPTVASIKSDYYPFGLPYQSGIVAGSPNNKYLYNGKELQDGTRLYDYGASLYDPVIGRWGTVDPLAEKYYGTSGYSYVENNPMVFTDPFGMDKNSTHTDAYGNVLGVYDDGDLGVYKHKNATTKVDVDKSYSKKNTSAGGLKMEESLHSLSFADQSLYNTTGDVLGARIQIKFGSSELTDKVNDIIEDNPSILEYARKAGTDGDWDLKNNTTDGSLLYGKYASPRDAGNFAAGMIAQMSGIEPIVQFGYGAYNLTGNNKILTGVLTGAVAKMSLISPFIGVGVGHLIGKYGEDKLTQRAIDLGKQHVQKRR